MSHDAIDQIHEKFLAAMRANDPQALGRLVSRDAVFMPPDEPNVVGARGVTDWFGGVVKKARTTGVTVSNRHVVVSGDWAIERGEFRWRLSPVGSPTSTENHGNFVAIYHRDPDGWKIKHNIWNSLAPAKAN